jgi:DNA-binding response OmpR family regulator
MDKTILIIDDSTYIVDGLVALLKRKGFHPVPAHGGEEGLGILKTTVPDLILLDIMMEPMDGWETLENIKANPATSNLPVLMFSAKKITPEEARDHSLDIEDFVSKPVNPAQLLDAIQRIFTRRAEVKEGAASAKNAGHDAFLVDECAALQKNIEVDKNLLEVLKKSCGLAFAGQELNPLDAESIKKLEVKIAADEQRLKVINSQLGKEA